MRQILAFVAILILIIACGNAASNESNATSEAKAQTASDADAVDGEKIYKQYCVTCHGLYGDMGASGAYNLTTSELTVEERITVITNGREGTTMVGFKSLLNEEKIKAVAEYTVKLKKD